MKSEIRVGYQTFAKFESMFSCLDQGDRGQKEFEANC